MKVKVRHGQGPLQHIIEIGSHTLLTDAPKALGGEETGPEPHDILAASLAACMALTCSMYARRKGMDLQDIHVSMEHGHHGGSYTLTRHLHFFGNLTSEERTRLTQIADKCPVHKTLSGQIVIIPGKVE